MVRWTGRGKLADLVASVRGVLGAERIRARVSVAGESVSVEGPEPVEVASVLENLPGVRWIAVGRSSDSMKGLMEELTRLAKVYVRPGEKFAVKGETHGADVKPLDLAGAGNSAVMDAVRGARVNEDEPSTVFRVAFDGRHGVAAVELKQGPGGTPTGGDVARCLVSGGMHSSVVAWNALLSGFSVQLVHAKVDDESLRAVASLYSELSHRVDPRKLELLVLEGGGVRRTLASWASRAPDPVFTGFHAERSSGRVVIPRGVKCPLYLLPEDEFHEIFSEMGLRQDGRTESWKSGGGGATRARSFGGARGDVSRVLDGLRKPSR
jgi:hypothetical protein